MAKPSQWTNGEKITHTRLNGMIDDGLSKTDTNDQNIASNLIFASGKKPTYDGAPGAVYKFVRSGTSPITFAHNIGQTPTGVIVTAKGSQTYEIGVDWNATNIIVYHNDWGSITVSIWAWVS